ncbi:MAG: ATP-binding cassette domain-containing protein [Actinobacteria bacterium]|nr:ATP-binding cassette domain-containing protein [Actinomycetota bacterium]
MTLLALEHVSKTYRRGGRELHALRDVSLELAAGELVGVWGPRSSGRTTLLRVAAGLEAPDRGRVLLDGVELSAHAEGALRRRVAYCHTSFAPAHGELVVEHVAVPLLAVGARLDRACTRAQAMLDRVGAGACAELRPHELAQGELMRVVLARALLQRPQLLLIDEPASGVDVLEREDLLTTLRVVAKDDRVAVLLTASETAGVAGADRVLALNDGALYGDGVRATGDVLPLKRPL